MEMLFIGNDNLLRMEALRDNLTGEPINDAIVAVTLTCTKTGDMIFGPAMMAFEAGSSGNYTVTIPASVPLDDHNEYKAHIAISAGGRTADLTVLARAHNR